MRKDFVLTLSFDTPNEELHDTFLNLMKDQARDVQTVAQLAYGSINDGGGPLKISLYSQDFLVGKEDIDFSDEEEYSEPEIDDDPADDKPDDHLGR